MHMADALLSPAVGVVMWAATGGTLAYCSRQVSDRLDDQQIPLMGVLAAFVFAAQMINFTIPGTGSSGHLGGGLLLAILLGPAAAFLAMASVLTVQALFFADGGLLALGCNIFNIGFFPCFIAYPFIYKPLAGARMKTVRMTGAVVIASVTALQMGSLGVVLETVTSGVSALPFQSFFLVMQPIHLAIGLVEGLVTAVVVNFMVATDPSIIRSATGTEKRKGIRYWIMAVLFGITIITGGLLSLFASDKPDGLEWSIARLTGSPELQVRQSEIHVKVDQMQRRISILPDYGLGERSEESSSDSHSSGWSKEAGGTAAAGIVGGLLVIASILLIGVLLRRKPSRLPDA